MKVVIYTRVSVQAQERFLDEQTEKLKKHAEKMEWNIIKTFADVGYSGRNMERPALQEMIGFIKTHDVDKVLVFGLNVLSLSPGDTRFLINDIFLKHNADFVSLYENIDTATPFDRTKMETMAAFAEAFARIENEQETPNESDEKTCIKELRKSVGMTQKAFGDYFNIPMRTIQHWESGTRECPEYLLKLIEYKLKNEGLIK
jgi:site-specific DNA recombinase